MEEKNMKDSVEQNQKTSSLLFQYDQLFPVQHGINSVLDP